MNDENQQQETTPSYVPTGQDASHARFTFVRCYARQVIQAYHPGEDSDEAKYYLRIAVLLAESLQQPLDDPKIHQFRFEMMKQLSPAQMPSWWYDGYVSEQWHPYCQQDYKKKQWFVLAPSGNWYKPMSPQYYTVTYTVHAGTKAMRISIHKGTGDQKHKHVVRVEWGPAQDRFLKESEVQIPEHSTVWFRHKELGWRDVLLGGGGGRGFPLFRAFNGSPRVLALENHDDSESEVEVAATFDEEEIENQDEEDQMKRCAKMCVKNVDDRVCLKKKKGKVHIWEIQANFAIEPKTYYKSNKGVWLLCECLTTPYEGADMFIDFEFMPLETQDHEVEPGKGKRIEVLLSLDPKATQPQALRNQFINRSSDLHALHLTIDMLTVLAAAKKVPYAECITNFGRQEDSDLYVFGDGCIKHGKKYDFEEMGVALLPEYFEKGLDDNRQPILRADFPVIGPQYPEWIGFGFMRRMLLVVMPAYFGVNYDAALANVLGNMAQLHSDLYWSGKVPGTNFTPQLYNYGPAGSGKSSVIAFCHKMNGFPGEMKTGFQTTTAETWAYGTHIGLPQFEEETITAYSSKEKKAEVADRIMAISGRSSRCKFGATPQVIKGPINMSSNVQIGKNNLALRDRLIEITWKTLKPSGYNKEAEEWWACVDNASKMFALLENMRSDGEFDVHAVADCGRFVDAVINGGSGHRSRHAHAVGKLVYNLVLLYAGLMIDDEAWLTERMNWLLGSAKRQNTTDKQYNSPHFNFARNVFELKTNYPYAGGNFWETVGWHNFRTTAVPFGRTGRWYAFNLQSLIPILRIPKHGFADYDAQRTQFHETPIGFENQVMISPCMFWDTTSGPMSSAGEPPLAEDLLDQDHMRSQIALFVTQSVMTEMMSHFLYDVTQTPPYQNVVIRSYNTEQEDYCVWDAFVNGWYGFHSAPFPKHSSYISNPNVESMRRLNSLTIHDLDRLSAMDKSPLTYIEHVDGFAQTAHARGEKRSRSNSPLPFGTFCTNCGAHIPPAMIDGEYYDVESQYCADCS